MSLFSPQLMSAYPRAVPLQERLYHGFVEIADIAALALKAGFRRAKGRGFLGRLATLMLTDEKHTVVEAVYASGRNSFTSILSTGRYSEAVSLMTKLGLHRIAVLGPSDACIVGVLTQRDIVRVIHSNVRNIALQFSGHCFHSLSAQVVALGRLAEQPVELLFETGAVTTLPQSATIRDCCDILLQRGVSAAPIVNEETGAMVRGLGVCVLLCALWSHVRCSVYCRTHTARSPSPDWFWICVCCCCRLQCFHSVTCASWPPARSLKLRQRWTSQSCGCCAHVMVIKSVGRQRYPSS